jgi:two-component system KDP operon response regulator KdpE
MIADDDAMVRRTLSSALGRVGFDVCTSPDGHAALRLAEIAPPDIALVDMNMPMGGVELVAQLKAMYGQQVWVAVLSGEDLDDIRDECLAAGADDVLVKPISPIELRRRLIAAAPAGKTLPVAS